jgi:hypothetical protein
MKARSSAAGVEHVAPPRIRMDPRFTAVRGRSMRIGAAPDPLTCPLCAGSGSDDHEVAHGRTFLRCRICRLVFVPPAQRPAPGEERAHYAHHQNDPDDPRYRRFLSRLAAPLMERLGPGAEGLDFGAGPGPALARMLEEAGYAMRIYDPFFAPDPAPLYRTYDFVTATEVLEHLHEPARTLDLLDRLVRPGGHLAVMTEPVPEERSFREWRYARDPTHIVFFSPPVFHWIADRYGWEMEAPDDRVVLFRKPT